MAADDRISLLRDLDEHAAFGKELATAALENPDDPERLVELRDAVFTLREVLDELGVPYARAGNDEWERVPSPQLLDSAIPFPLFGLPDGTLTPRGSARPAIAATWWTSLRSSTAPTTRGSRWS